MNSALFPEIRSHWPLFNSSERHKGDRSAGFSQSDVRRARKLASAYPSQLLQTFSHSLGPKPPKPLWQLLVVQQPSHAGPFRGSVSTCDTFSHVLCTAPYPSSCIRFVIAIFVKARLPHPASTRTIGLASNASRCWSSPRSHGQAFLSRRPALRLGRAHGLRGHAVSNGRRCHD